MPNTLRGLLLLSVAVGSLAPSASGAGASTGSTWYLVKSPSVPGVGQNLNAVTAVSAIDAWTVGSVYDKQLGDEETLTQHWDGVAWRTMPSRSFANSYNTLYGVSGTASNDVWATGYTIDDDSYRWQALAMHWNGTS